MPPDDGTVGRKNVAYSDIIDLFFMFFNYRRKEILRSPR